MRFIKGDSLMEAIAAIHADESLKKDPSRRALRLRELLTRFQDVCNAIAYAHSRGVLHRDLKPDSIMLGPYGETLVVDWGLAKPTGGQDHEADSAAVADGPIRLSAESGSRAETLPGSVMGTPADASSEQSLGRLDLLKPASDVHSLGATLYALLTGRPPVTGNDLQEILCKVEKGEIALPRSVGPTIPKPLETVCLRAMALNPKDRYETASGLRADLERWLADETVTAWREPPTFRARQWMRRHRLVVTSTATAAVVGLLGLVGFAAVISGKNLELLDKNLDLAIRNQELRRKRHAAVEERDHARKLESETKAVLDSFEQKVLAATRPEGQDGGLDKDVTIRRAVDAAEPKIAQAFRAKPVVEASIRNTLGQTYRHLGEPTLAVAQFERGRQLLREALGPDHPETLSATCNLAKARAYASRLDDAVGLLEETVNLMKARLGDDNPETLVTLSDLRWAYLSAGRLNEAVPVLEETLQLQRIKLKPHRPDTFATMSRVVWAFDTSGRVTDAVPLLDEMLELGRAQLGPDLADPLVSIGNSALAYQNTGRLRQAVPLFEGALKRRTSWLGVDHPNTLDAMNLLAIAYQVAGRTKAATALFEETLEKRKAMLGVSHPDTLFSESNLSVAYQSAGRLTDALPLYEDILKFRKAKLGPDHPDTLLSANYLAIAYEKVGRLDDVVPLFEETLRLRRVKLGSDHPDTLVSMNNLALAYEKSGRLNDTVSLVEELMRRRRGLLGPINLVMAPNFLATAYHDASRVNEALPRYQASSGPGHLGSRANSQLRIQNLNVAPPAPPAPVGSPAGTTGTLIKSLPLLEQAFARRKSRLGPDHPDTLLAMDNLAVAYEGAARLKNATSLFEVMFALRKTKFGLNYPDTLASINYLGVVYQKAGRLREALPLLERAFELRKMNLGPDQVETLASMKNLVQTNI
jgi:tetratricopeptide (TPR) repeat protein